MRQPHLKNLWLLFAVSVSVSGCGRAVETIRADLGLRPAPESQTSPLSERLPQVPAPALRPGDSYVFRFPNGVEQTETVTAVSGDRVSWRIPSGATWTTLSGTMFNTSEWSGSTGYGDGRQRFSGNYADLFPLRVGNVARYVARGQSSKQHGAWTHSWICTVPSEESVTVVAGTFDTYRVMCYRSGQLRTYFYAPAVNMYVLRVVTGADPGRKELVSYRVGGR